MYYVIVYYSKLFNKYQSGWDGENFRRFLCDQVCLSMYKLKYPGPIIIKKKSLRIDQQSEYYNNV